ncbi:MAG: GNAT family N-acetyltransferase [Chitinophagaceae bacterium]|nr:MAG: GNAT family N-acetyltransferase [Chitinophagaceae bacterium]
MNPTIRPARKEDCERMMELIRELADYEKAPDEVTVTMEHFIESGFGKDPVWYAWVVEESGVVVGFALYYIRYSTWKGQRMYLEDILVTESHRGKGFGKLLLDKLIAICKEKGYSGMMWQVLDWNEPAIHFYEKFPGTTFSSEWVNVSLEVR